MLSGVASDGLTRLNSIVASDKLEAAKSALSAVNSVHVYSVEPGTPVSACNQLCNTRHHGVTFAHS